LSEDTIIAGLTGVELRRDDDEEGDADGDAEGDDVGVLVSDDADEILIDGLTADGDDERTSLLSLLDGELGAEELASGFIG
jgi:hypothetical protein